MTTGSVFTCTNDAKIWYKYAPTNESSTFHAFDSQTECFVCSRNVTLSPVLTFRYTSPFPAIVVVSVRCIVRKYPHWDATRETTTRCQPASRPIHSRHDRASPSRLFPRHPISQITCAHAGAHSSHSSPSFSSPPTMDAAVATDARANSSSHIRPGRSVMISKANPAHAGGSDRENTRTRAARTSRGISAMTLRPSTDVSSCSRAASSRRKMARRASSRVEDARRDARRCFDAPLPRAAARTTLVVCANDDAGIAPRLLRHRVNAGHSSGVRRFSLASSRLIRR